MSSFNKKIRGLNAEISEISSKLYELNGFQDVKPKSIIDAPYMTSKVKATKKGAQETDKRVAQEVFKGDGTEVDTEKLIKSLQAQLIRAKKEHLSQINRLKTELDRCKSEKAALSKSLESSERIRQQQKTLITLLQQGTHLGMEMENAPESEDNSVTPSMRDENRLWLNPSNNKESASIVSGLSETASEGSTLNKRRNTRSRKHAAAGTAGAGTGVAFRTRDRSMTSAPFPRSSAQPSAKPPIRKTRANTLRSQRVPNAGSRTPPEGSESTVAVSADLARRQRDYSARLAYSRQRATAPAASPSRNIRVPGSSTPSRTSFARKPRSGSDTPSPRRALSGRVSAPGTPTSVQRCTFGSR